MEKKMYEEESYMDHLKKHQTETDALEEKKKTLKSNLEDLEKELELLEESFKVLEHKADLNEVNNLSKVKTLIRKRSEDFRNQIKLCLSIVERTLDFAEKPESLKTLKTRLETELEKEEHKLNQIETLYESEARHSLRRNEELWHSEHENRYKHIKQALMDEHQLINTILNDITKKHDIVHNQQAEHATIAEDKCVHAQQGESNDNNLSPRCFDVHGCNDIDQASNSFNNLNFDELCGHNNHPSRRELEDEKTNAQRSMQVVSAETEAERPRFGRKHLDFN